MASEKGKEIVIVRAKVATSVNVVVSFCSPSFFFILLEFIVIVLLIELL